MRILVTNDDGIYAPGLAALAEAAAKVGEVHVVAPVVEQSGVAHTISLQHPLRVVEIDRGSKLFGRAVSGAPADCVRLAVRELLHERPNLVLSGVNLGANVGCDVLYSGTVAAAIEGALLGIPSVAVSIEHGRRPDFALAAHIGLVIARHLLALAREVSGLPLLLNVNVPCLPRSRIRGVQITRQSRHGGEEGFVKRKDPRGRFYYWFSEGRAPHSLVEGTDIAALRRGYVSVTPLNYDLTEERLMSILSTQEWSLSEISK